MISTKQHIHGKFWLFHNKELDELYVSMWLKSLAESFINIFIPIFMLQLGYGLQDIAIYYGINFIATFFFIIIGMKSNSKFGIKKTMGIWIAILAIFFVLISRIEFGLPYIIPSILSGVSIWLYYSSFHIFVSKFADKSHEGVELSFIKIITIMAHTVWPLVGALFINSLSFYFLFSLVAILLVLAMIPLFMSKDTKTPRTKITTMSILKADEPMRWLVYSIDWLLYIIAWIFWPIFIYMTLKSVVSLWWIISITSLIMIWFLIYIGKRADSNKNKVFKFGVSAYSLSWISKVLFISPIWVFINNFISALASTSIDISFSKMVYEKSRKVKDISQFFIFRELFLMIGKLLLVSIIFFYEDIYITFILAFFFSLLYFLVLLPQQKKQK